MKKSIFILGVMLSGILVTTILSCEENPSETCVQDEICTAVFVDACCDDNDICVYKYNGNEYTEDEYDQLVIDTGCGSAKSAGTEDNITNVVARLKALMARVKEQIRSNRQN